MKIGITYDLREDYLKEGFTKEETAEFDKRETIDAIECTLNSLGYQTEKIGHIKNLCSRLNQGKKWDLVFNISEGLYGIGREAQVPGLLDAYNIPYVFSGPLVMALTLHKGMTKHIIKANGLATPDFYVVHKIEDINKINIPYPLFAKPVAEGTGKGINAKSIVCNKEQLKASCKYLLDKFKQPVLIEEFLSGREFTVGVVGTGDEARSIGLMEVILNEHAEQDVYSYDNKEDYLQRVEYILADDETAKACEQLAVASFRCLECEDGGRVDIRLDKNGVPNFIEINPLAGLNPIHSDLPILSQKNGISYKELIKMIMDSAIKKIKKTL